jgi:polar amino acid transport system substrate-binding protein
MTSDHPLPKLITFIAVVLLCSLWFPRPAQQPLRWGADPSGGAPYVFNDPNHPDQYIGYEKRWSMHWRPHGPQPEFVPSDWETLVSALQRGSFDVIVNGLEPTGDRAKQIQFSKPTSSTGVDG